MIDVAPPTSRREWVAAALGLCLLSLLVVGLHLGAYRKVSPIDEFQHIDSAWKISHGFLPRHGELVGDVAMEIESCRGLDAQYPLPACGPKDSRDRPQFQESGFNTAYVHNPIYYVVAGLSGRALSGMGLTDFLDGARLTGAGWLALGLIGCWVLLGLLGLRGWWRFAAAASPVLLPGVVYTSSILNPDATALAAGAWVAVAVLSVSRARWPMWTVVAISAGAVALKSTNLVVVGVSVVMLLLEALRDPARRRGLAATAVGCALTVPLVAMTWTSILGPGRRVKIPMLERFKTAELTVPMITRNLAAAVPPTKGAYDPVLGAGSLTIAVGLALTWLLAAGPLLAAVHGGDDETRSLARSALLAAFATGPVLIVVQYVVLSIYVDIPGRYGMSLLPAMAAVTLAVASPRKWRLWTLLVIVGTGVVLIQLVTSI